MAMHNLSAKVLCAILDSRSWTQAELADKAGLPASVVSWHLSRQRTIRDDHLIAYLSALRRRERQELLAAWLRDSLTGDIVADVLNLRDDRVREGVQNWTPPLEDPHGSMLNWWAHHIA